MSLGYTYPPREKLQYYCKTKSRHPDSRRLRLHIHTQTTDVNVQIQRDFIIV